MYPVAQFAFGPTFLKECSLKAIVSPVLGTSRNTFIFQPSCKLTIIGTAVTSAFFFFNLVMWLNQRSSIRHCSQIWLKKKMRVKKFKHHSIFFSTYQKLLQKTGNFLKKIENWQQKTLKLKKLPAYEISIEETQWQLYINKYKYIQPDLHDHYFGCIKIERKGKHRSEVNIPDSDMIKICQGSCQE